MPKGTVKAPAFVATLTTLTDEVGDGLYCNRMGISAGQCRSAWLGLCDFIFNVLKKNKASTPRRKHVHTEGEIRNEFARGDPQADALSSNGVSNDTRSFEPSAVPRSPSTPVTPVSYTHLTLPTILLV